MHMTEGRSRAHRCQSIALRAIPSCIVDNTSIGNFRTQAFPSATSLLSPANNLSLSPSVPSTTWPGAPLLSQSIGTAVTPANNPSVHAIVFHPNRYSTNPPQSGPRNSPINEDMVWMPNACATAPRLPNIPGRARSISSRTCCVSTYSAGTQALMNRPMRVRRERRRTMCGVVLDSTKRRLMRGGERRRKPVKVTRRAP